MNTRIKNGTFTINGQTSHIPTNEHGGEDTLHGGFVGYDQQNWTVASVSGNSITFVFYDAAQSGFPGDVLNVATYTLTDDASWISRMVSIPMNEATPIMLANHVYWNLGAYVNQEAALILDNTLYMPYADRIVQIDGIEVPTGGIGVTNGTAFDFTKPGKTIGQDINSTMGACGAGCTGYDNAFILDRPRYSAPDDPELEVLQMRSPVTGITMTLQTNQQSIQIYACTGQNGSIKVKSDQQHLNGTTYVEKYVFSANCSQLRRAFADLCTRYGCVVIETQDVSIPRTMAKDFIADLISQWIDGINNPQWGRQQWQIFSPTTEPAMNYQKYTFTVS